MSEMENKLKNGFGLKVLTTKTPQPNAPTYELKTIDDIFQLALKLPKNKLKRFLKEFSQGMEVSVSMNKVMAVTIKAQHPEIDVDKLLTMPSFNWIDD